MASWIDVFALVITTLFFVGTIAGVLYAVHTISSRLQSTKASLEHRGIAISRDGVSVKTQRRFDRDAYLDATQRGIVKALGAATVGPESNQHAFLSRSNADPTSTSNLGRARAGSRDEKRASGVALRRSRSD